MTTTSPARTSLSGAVADFAAAARPEHVPDEVYDRARHLVLDAVGLAFASTAYRFVGVARDALPRVGGAGSHPVLGMPDRLSGRDAAVLNGVLIHGLDFDDTHIPAITHVTAGVLPVALSAATAAGASTRELLLAYVLGVEVSARVGLGGAGGFHDVGWHPTAVAGAFGASVAAGKLAGLDAAGLVAALGVVGSMAGGLLEFLEDGSWTKRLHPGWAAMCGLTAASFAGVGWSGPPAVYEPATSSTLSPTRRWPCAPSTVCVPRTSRRSAARSIPRRARWSASRRRPSGRRATSTTPSSACRSWWPPP